MKKLHLSKTIITVSLLAFACVGFFSLPKTSNAADHQPLFAGLFGEIYQSDTPSSDYAREITGYNPNGTDSDIPGDEKFSGGSPDPGLPRTYYGQMKADGMSDDDAAKATMDYSNEIIASVDAYRAAAANGEGKVSYVDKDGSTTYTITNASQLAGIKAQAQALINLNETLSKNKAGVGDLVPSDAEAAVVMAAQQQIQNIDAGKVPVGSTLQSHAANHLEGSDLPGVKNFDSSGNKINETRVSSASLAPPAGIFCMRIPEGLHIVPEVDVPGCIALGLYHGLLKPSSWVLFAAGVAFNYSIDFTLNFGKFIRDEGLGTPGSANQTPGAIYLGWAAIRDLINVGFIFILLYAGIATILGLDGYGVKQTIIKVVIAALLLNFSLFFTKAAIDLSNIIALQFYTRVLSASNQANSSDTAIANAGDWDAGISIGFVNALGLKSIWNGKADQGSSATQASSAFGGVTAGQLIIICLGGSAFILVTAFVFFMATIRFMYRSIVLIFLMILSPIGFVGGAIPALKGAAGKWQSRLKDNLIFAPAYMAIFYVVALIVFGKNIGPSQVGANSVVGSGGYSGFGALFQGNVANTGIMMWFIMIIGLMLGTQLVADSFADKVKLIDSIKKKTLGGAKWVGKKYAGGFGLAGYTGRRALGAAGNIATGKVGQALLLNGLVRNLGGDKLYNKLGNLKEVKVGKKSLDDVVKDKKKLSTDVYKKQVERTTRKRGEDKAVYEARRDQRRREVDTKYYGAEYDPITGKVNWDKAEAYYNKTYGKSRRKMRLDRIGEAKKGPPKDRNVGDLEKRMDEIEGELKETETHVAAPGRQISKIEKEYLEYVAQAEAHKSTTYAAAMAGTNVAAKKQALEMLASFKSLAGEAKKELNSLKREKADLSKKIADMNAKP